MFVSGVKCSCDREELLMMIESLMQDHVCTLDMSI